MGDQQLLQITGGPQMCSMLSAENPETEGQVYSVAPAEGQRPINIMTDSNFELMCNPDKFPFGTGGFNQERARKITYRKYFQQRLLDVDGRFSRDLDYLFAAQYIVESKQVFDDASHFIWRQKPSVQLTASQARNSTIISESICRDKAYACLKNVRGSPAYYQRTFYELLAMIRQLGTPTWFFTLSAADMKWPEVIQTIAKQYGVAYTDEEVCQLSFEERSNWLRRNPVTAARHFQYRLDVFFKDFLKSSVHPLGEITDEAIRIEFQNRGSPHAHCVLWVKGAPKFSEHPDGEVCNFIDKYIACNIPNDNEKLKELVLLVQQHKHSTYCKRNKQCRFSFPQPPSSCTLISQPYSDDDTGCNSKSIVECLSKVKKLLIEGNTNVSLLQLLEMGNIKSSDYEKALHTSSSGNKVILKRDPSDCNINNYNPSVLLAWQANMDIQYVMDAYACVMYVASYMMKHEKSMGELLKNVATEVRTEELNCQLRKVGTAFLTHREVSAQEAVYRILSMPMKHLSRSVVFVDTNPKNQRIAVLKSIDVLKQLDEEDTNVFEKSLVDRYQHRPHSIQSMCLAEFAATYVVQHQKDNEEQSDVLPVNETETMSSQIVLSNGFGKMHQRKRQAVIRFRRYNKDSEPSNWHRAKLMLYFPWYNEQSDLLGGCATYEEHYHNVVSVVVANEQKFTISNVEDADFDVENHPQHMWDQLAPSTEESRVRSQEEGEESLTNTDQQDLTENSRILERGNAVIGRYESAANMKEIPPDEYRRMMRELNNNQKAVVMFHRNWCKKAVVALRNGQPVEPYRVFMSGPGGVGKSHVIRLIHSDTLKLLRLSECVQPDDVTVLLTAPTGVAAFNIGGMTLHSALLLNCGRFGYQPLSSERLNTLRAKLSNLLLIIIDEVSMVGSNMLLEIHRRLQQIKGVSPDVLFGGVSILAVGDLYQLPPVGQPAVFDRVADPYVQFYASGSLWQEEFEMIELTEVMRQKGASGFIELLGKVRTGSCTEEDLQVLQSRVITTDSVDYPSDALHVYRLNVDVDKRNEEMLKKLAANNQQYCIASCDSIGGQTDHIDLTNLSQKRSETGGLHSTLKLTVGARVMLTANVDVSDGLVNGARGDVVHIVVDSNEKVTKVLVQFDNPSVGRVAIQSSSYRNAFGNAVPLGKHEATFLARGRRGSEVIRLQFPLTLAWATTIHKVQGLTLDKIVVDMEGGQRFSRGQAYVAFSRVKALDGLYILNFDSSAIKKNEKVSQEMLRLHSKHLTCVPTLKCHELLTSHVTIALLNVRCVCAKLSDLMCDDDLKCANILCLCETWLSPSQNFPVLMNNHKTLRSDRIFHNNKGGVLISVDQSFTPSDTVTFSNYGIEGIITQLEFPNSVPVRVVLLYRSPSTSLSQFENVLQALLAQLPGNVQQLF